MTQRSALTTTGHKSLSVYSSRLARKNILLVLKQD